MSTASFMTADGFNRIKTIHRLQRVLQREKKVYLKELHCRCGVGFTVEEFDTIVKGLAEEQLCSLQVGALGATLVVVNQPDAMPTQ